ncbi:hypothetical protein BJX76DRAFT_1788 [Aspergillus varians]
MSTDQLLCPMDLSSRQDEWLDFDNLFQLPSDYLDSNPTSVESISPRDLEQSFTDADFLNWDPAMCAQPMFPDFAGYEAPIEGLELSAFEFQPFINPNDVLRPVQPSPQNQVVDAGFESAWIADLQNFGHPSSFRYTVESQAALDNRCFSQKEKRRDASIALHLQRMQNVLPSDLNTPSLSSNHLSSPDWSDSSLEMTPCERSSTIPITTPVSESQKLSPPASGSEPGAASMQLVLDLNMNTTTNVPKKQKPRSKTQRENYIKARKYGVCEKHRKQHKRCNCIEKAAAARLNTNTSCAGANTIAGLHTNHERALANTSLQRSVQGPTSSANTGPLRPTHPVRVERPDLSYTQPLASTGRDQVTVGKSTNVQKQNCSHALPLQLFVSSTSHNGVAAQNSHQLFTSGGSLSAPARYRDRDSQNKQHFTLTAKSQHSCQTPRQSVDQQLPSGCRGALNVQNSPVSDCSLAKRAGTIACNTAFGLLSFWQGSTTLSSWAGFFFGRLAVFSSRLFIQSRKGMGCL